MFPLPVKRGDGENNSDIGYTAISTQEGCVCGCYRQRIGRNVARLNAGACLAHSCHVSRLCHHGSNGRFVDVGCCVQLGVLPGFWLRDPSRTLRAFLPLRTLRPMSWGTWRFVQSRHVKAREAWRNVQRDTLSSATRRKLGRLHGPSLPRARHVELGRNAQPATASTCSARCNPYIPSYAAT